MSPAEPIETPCIDICVIDPETDLCEGCGRSLDQIALWTTYSPAERRRIMDELEVSTEGHPPTEG